MDVPKVGQGEVMRRLIWAGLLAGAVGCSGGNKIPVEEGGGTSSTDSDGDGVAAATDCDDDDASIFPGAE